MYIQRKRLFISTYLNQQIRTDLNLLAGTPEKSVMDAAEEETSLRVVRKEYLNEYQTQTRNIPTYFSNLCAILRQLSQKDVTESTIESLSTYIRIIVSSDLIDQNDYSVVLRILAIDFQYDLDSFICDVLRNCQLSKFISVILRSKDRISCFYFPGAVILDRVLMK